MRTITITSLVQTDSRSSKLLEIGQTKVNPKYNYTSSTEEIKACFKFPSNRALTEGIQLSS
jgi:hypothetical protein